MIAELLNTAAIPAKEARYPDPPALHAVWFDSVDGDGPDLGAAQIFQHDGDVELYAADLTSGKAALRRLTDQLDARSIHYSTQGWYWMKEIRRYQEIISFTYIEKT